MRLLSLVFFTALYSTYGQVNELANLPHFERDDALAFSIGNTGYLVTGNHNGFSESNRLWCYNNVNNSWIEGTSFPGTPRQYATCFSIGNSGYIIGGISENGTPLNDVWEYQSCKNSWIQLGDFPGIARWGASACSLNNYGYFVGGTDGQSCTNTGWRFNPIENTWDSLSSYPGIGTREGVLLALSNSLVYVGGFSINPLNCQTKTYVYNFDSKSWVTGVDFPLSQSSYLSGNGLFNTGYVLSGWGCDNTFSNTIWETDGTTWTFKDSLPLTGIRGMSTFEINGCVYALTGLEDTGQKTNRIFRIGAETTMDEIVFYPNPAHESTHVYAPIGSEIVIYDLTGKKILNQKLVTNMEQLFLNPGSYIVTVDFKSEIKLFKIILY